MSFFTINVSLSGKHYFATAKHSLTNGLKAAETLRDFIKRFPKKEGFDLTLSYSPGTEYTSYKTDLYAIKDADIDQYIIEFAK